MALYESEHTKFMREWLEKHPGETEVKKTGRALWWDKAPQHPEEARRLKDSKVPQKSYYYLTN